MTNIIKLKKESNIIDFQKEKEKRANMGISEEEFRKKYMQNSLVSLYGKKSMEILNQKDEDNE